MFFVMLGKIACYGAMSVRATDFGVVNLAAHSIMMRVFFFFTCWGDSLSQATQSFLPKSLYPKPVKKDVRKIMKRLVIFASCVGSFIFLASRFILTKCGGYLTNDATVVAAIVKYSKLASMSLLLHPFILLSEGSMIATRDFRYLISSYSITMAMHFGLLLLACSSFADIWRVFFTFQAVRVTLFGTRAIRSVVLNKKQSSSQTETAAAAA
jgi:Na+-driven multidrug efflux pump